MKFVKLCAVVFISSVFLLAACKGSARKEPQERVLATVNGVAITGDDLYIRLGGHAEYLSAPEGSQALDDLITEELLYQRGVKLGLDKDPKFQNTIRQMEKKILAYKRSEISRRVKDSQIFGKMNIKDAEIDAYAAAHAAEIQTELHLGAAQFEKESDAREAAAKIAKGTSFETIAAAQTAHGPRGKRPAWDLGYLRWSQIPPEFLDTVYALKKGEVSGVMNRGKLPGFYLVKVLDKRKSTAASQPTLSPDISNRIVELKMKEAYTGYVQQLKKEASIQRQ